MKRFGRRRFFPFAKKGHGSASLAGILLLSSLLAVGCARDAEDTLRGDDRAAKIDALFASSIEGESPGASVIVIRGGEILHQAGYGFADLEAGVPIGPETTFRLASVSKQFTAMAVMMLAEQGDLAYDDPVVDYLPELARYGDGITIRHLLTHTSGLPDYYDDLEAQAVDEMPTNADAAAFFSRWGEPLFAPGERYEYSNPGYEMLSLVVARVSGQSFAELLASRIFEPLGMRNSVVFDHTEPEVSNRAYGYAREGDGFVRNDDHRLNHLDGSGGIYSSVEDMYLWDQALSTETLVRRETLEEAFTPARLSSGEGVPYGFGWGLRPVGALGSRIAHSGGWLGFGTYYARYPEKQFSVIVLSNFEEVDAGELAHRITDIYYPTRLIAGATIVDGTGSAPVVGSVRVEGDRIIAVGDLEPTAGELVVEAGGLVLAPGFVDTHSHADDQLLERPEALAAVSQGITTVVVGQDGGARHPLREFFAELEETGVAVNVASFAGHGTLREEVMGEDFRRPATDEEVDRMRLLLREEMEAGALGLATGLEYDPGIYSTTEEVVALAREAAAHGGRYSSHIRSEDRYYWEAIEEILTIGREAAIPVQISHLKLALRSLHGQTDRLLGRLEAARASGIDVTADIYPYIYWQSTLTVLFPERDFENRASAAFALEEISAPEDMIIAVFEPEPSLAGKTLAAIAERRQTDAVTTLIDLIREAEAFEPEEEGEEVESVIAASMTEADIDELMRWPHANICTDGGLAGTHPRGFGSFPRVLGRSVRERRIMTVEQAVHQMSVQAAAHVGIGERGIIRPGMKADLVLFDPDTILDRATTDDPHALSTGIEKVWVSGQLVYEGGRATGRLPGEVIRRQAAPE